MEPKIARIRIEVLPDECPDLSFLGEYSNSLKPGGIDRKERGDQERNEYRFFNPGCGDPEYIEEDYTRMESYNRGSWGMVGIRAVADVLSSDGRIESFTSGGLWGIESDSGRKYFRTVAKDELADLKTHLESFGVNVRGFVKMGREALGEIA